MPSTEHPPPRRLVRSAAPGAALAATVLLVGCGSGAEPGSATEPATPSASQSATASASESAAPAGQTVELDLTGDRPPEARTVEVGAGEPVTLAIDAAEAGELHVHSTPEQEVAYATGTSEHELRLDRPGVVDVESHDLGVVLVRLEVR